MEEEKDMAEKPQVEEPPFPKEDWFGEKELDNKLHLIDYIVDGEKKQVAFYIRSMSAMEARKLIADYQELNEKTGLVETDFEAYQDRMLQEVVSYGEPPKNLSRQELEAIKRNKKAGLYNQIAYLATIQSGIEGQELIDKEKK